LLPPGALPTARATSATLFFAADLIGLLFLPADPDVAGQALDHIPVLRPPAFAVVLGLPAYYLEVGSMSQPMPRPIVGKLAARPGSGRRVKRDRRRRRLDARPPAPSSTPSPLVIELRPLQ